MNRIPLLFTLLSLLIVLIGYLLYLSKTKKSPISREASLSVLVSFYKISSLKSTLIYLLLYFSITVGLFFFVRILNIGYNRALFSLSVPKVSINLLIVILILVSFILLLGLLKALFYTRILQEMFKLYLYLLTLGKGKHFIEFLFDRYHDTKGSYYIDNCYFFLLYINPEWEMNSFILKGYNEDHLITIETIHSIRNILQKNPIICKTQHLVFNIISLLKNYWWALRYYSIYIILYCVILYDLIQEVIYYTYFTLPIFMLITLYRNLLSFVGTKDFYVLDPILSAYIYEKGCSLDVLYSNEHNIREYLFNGYRGEHASDFFKEKTPSIDPTFVLVKRLYLLISICITSWILLFHTTLLNTLWLTLFLVLSFNTIEFNLSIINQSKKLFKKIVFDLSVTSMVFINIWVYLTRHNHDYVRDVIWNKGVIIKQTFTLEEKITFLYKYLNYTLDNLNNLSEDVKGIILSKITDKDLLFSITEETTIQQIRYYIEQLPQVYLRLERFYDIRFLEILSETQVLAQNQLDYELTNIWIERILFLMITLNFISKAYQYFTNDSKDLILYKNIVSPKAIEIFIKYIKSFF